jgi:hypothetical protein
LPIGDEERARYWFSYKRKRFYGGPRQQRDSVFLIFGSSGIKVKRPRGGTQDVGIKEGGRVPTQRLARSFENLFFFFLRTRSSLITSVVEEFQKEKKNDFLFLEETEEARVKGNRNYLSVGSF